jgi:heme-degrading monooxygenase HmoA
MFSDTVVGPLMYARVTTIVFAPTEQDDAETLFRQVLPTVEELAGFKGMLILSGIDARSLVAMTFWDTAEALKAAEPVLESVKRAETSFRQVDAKDTARFYVAGSTLKP